MEAKFVYENIRFERTGMSPESLGIGNKEAQAKNRIQKFAEANGWEYYLTPRGVQTLTKPLTMEVKHDYASSGIIFGNRGGFTADALRYKIKWQNNWEDEGTPLSLRKVYMRNGKETKQNLMGRLPDAREVIRRIELNFPKELKKANS